MSLIKISSAFTFYNIIDPFKDIMVLSKFIRIRLELYGPTYTESLHGKCTGQNNSKMNCPRKVAKPVGDLGEQVRDAQEATP